MSGLLPGNIKARGRDYRFIWEPEKSTVYLFDVPGQVPSVGTAVPAVLAALYDADAELGLSLPDEPSELQVLTVTEAGGERVVQSEDGEGWMLLGGATATDQARALAARDAAWPAQS